MENNFNLKKFLIENKLTTNSRQLAEQEIDIDSVEQEFKKILPQPFEYKPGDIADTDLYYSDKLGKFVSRNSLNKDRFERLMLRGDLTHVYSQGDTIEDPDEELIEQEIDIDSVEQSSIPATKKIPNDIIWTDEEEDTARHGTFNPWDLDAENLEEYEVELLGISPSTGRAYIGYTQGSYGETDYHYVSNEREMTSKESESYFAHLRKNKPEYYSKLYKE